MRASQRLFDDINFTISRVMRDGEEYADYLRFVNRIWRYSMNNSLLIYGQNPECTHLEGRKNWEKAYQRFVSPGAQPIYVLYPMQCQRVHPKEIRDEFGNIVTLDTYTAYGTREVYDVSQTRGGNIIGCDRADVSVEDDYLGIVKGIVAQSRAGLSYSKDVPTLGLYDEDENRIILQQGADRMTSVMALVIQAAFCGLFRDRATELLDMKSKKVLAKSIAFLIYDKIGINPDCVRFPEMELFSKNRSPALMRGYLKAVEKIKEEMLAYMAYAGVKTK